MAAPLKFMPFINSTKFGEIVIDNKKYHQVLIAADKAAERDYEQLKELFGTSHQIADWEEQELFSQEPEVIVIGTGQDGMLKVSDELLEKAARQGIELITETTPRALEIYNQKVKQGKRVNALMHTTC